MVIQNTDSLVSTKTKLEFYVGAILLFYIIDF